MNFSDFGNISNFLKTLSLKFFQQLVRQHIYTRFLLIITLYSTCGERKSCSTFEKSQNIMSMIVCKLWFSFVCLLRALIVKNSHVLAGIYFICLKERTIPNLKSIKRTGKHFSSKTYFKAFLAISCSNFKLQLYAKHIRAVNIVKKIKFERLWVT